ncbi:uncharacterized protein F5891DRAFT_1066667 [Suillus fuscotomentosus]|uniref:Uncharacterized protein n=1 Tax=Suillus fuscotomentosus TaxID=1912939 RepID=A0AAD4HED8_9AGAM|nr:uncharacterized protein F5891DRAFT_1066667 [Suillus fuscotomentosus]KAG1893442.1 hypothetical protein F5891DRAFT_1066667 [Suillus fuscotomentosus]
MLRNHNSDSVRRLIHRFRVLMKVLFRYIAFPLRLVHHLWRTLLRLYYDSRSIASRRRFQRIHTDEHPERVAGSRQPTMILPLSNPHPQVSPSPGPASCSSRSLLPVQAPPSSSSCVLQLSPAVPVIPQSRSSTTFEPFVPSDVMRYDKTPSINPENNKYKFIPPKTTDFLDPRQQDCGDWHACIHPEGALYFHNPTRGIYTDSNLQNEDRRCKMDSCVDEVLALTPPELQLCCDKIELVVQLAWNQKSKVRICRYYFIDHDKHLLFWLHELPTVKLFCGVQGVEKLSHIKYAVEHQYWQHCEMYPNANLPCARLLKELKEVVVHASAETVTTDVSLSPFDGDELSKILDLIDQLGDNIGGTYSICVIARFMRYFVRAKFFNFCGLPAARLDADQTVYKKKKRNKLVLVLSWTFNVAMFGAPQSHMEELRRVWVDRSINSPRWKNFNSKLSTEWSSITMYSTVMIAVDVSFLAVPSVSNQNSGSVPIISTYLSIFCIVGSLVVSLFLTRQNRLYGQESADTAVDFLTKMTGSAFGTKAVATVHGLPYAMLLWGMLYFMLAFSYQVFTSTPTLTLATTGSACGLVALFTLWLIYAARDFHISTRFLEWLRASICKARDPNTA